MDQIDHMLLVYILLIAIFLLGIMHWLGMVATTSSVVRDIDAKNEGDLLAYRSYYETKIAELSMFPDNDSIKRQYIDALEVVNRNLKEYGH